MLTLNDRDRCVADEAEIDASIGSSPKRSKVNSHLNTQELTYERLEIYRRKRVKVVLWQRLLCPKNRGGWANLQRSRV